IVSYDPMYVYFEIDERTALRLHELREQQKIHYDKEGGVVFYFSLATEEGVPTSPWQPAWWRRSGVITFFDNKLDAGTGTLRMRGVFNNPDKLAPGLFARVRLLIGKPYEALLVPERALGTDQGQKFLYVLQTFDVKDEKGNLVKDEAGNVKKEDRAIYRKVEVGALIDAQERMRVVKAGIAAGDRVVVNG